MKKKIKTIGIVSIIILAGLSIMMPVQANKLEATPIIKPIATYYVDDNNTEGPWNGTEEHPFQIIQDAIDQAYIPGPGWRIWYKTKIIVKSGLYNEDLLINKTLILQGENKEDTIINGSGTSNAIKITAEGVTVKGFTIQHGGIVHPGAGVYVLANYTKIENNLIKDNYEGIYLKNLSCNCTINNNVINGRLTLKNSNYNTISNNIITSTYEGIAFSLSHYNKIFKNTIKDCNPYNNPNLCGVTLWSSSNNVFYLNNFINNTNGNSKEENEKNQWDNGIQGNYWDDYIGSDDDNDGIGDSSYPINELGNQDKNPLMKPFDEYEINVILECENSFKQIFPGQTIIFEIDITNIGDIIERYNIKSYLWDFPILQSSRLLMPPYPFISFSNDTVTLKPSETKTIYVYASVFYKTTQLLEQNIWAVSQSNESVKEKTRIYIDVKSVKVDLDIENGFNSPKISIKNTGDAILRNLNYTISIKGSRKRSINITHEDKLNVLYVDTETQITIPRGLLKRAFGFVTIKIHLEENIDGRLPLEEYYTFKGFCFGRYIKILPPHFLPWLTK